jgi:hypothetical protein
VGISFVVCVVLVILTLLLLLLPNARGYNWDTLFQGEINTGTWPSRLGKSQK